MKLYELIVAGGVVVMATLTVSKVIVPQLENEDERTDQAQATPQETNTTHRPEPISANSAQLRLENDGHYWASANVDGAHVRFMVDTGASTVALTYNDAQRIGLSPDELDYRWTIRTAGGEVKGASVLLNSIQIGRVEVENVEAMILRDGLNQSLLGMSFLSELESYEFRRGKLILRQ
ncbi:MAG: TIGR02281 family clan AA aspartic protease [Hyphomonadaceae bacterium]|nr:TIGR02281 family clan AA aspartic protease [Hyphomonadaceae bacterium]